MGTTTGTREIIPMPWPLLAKEIERIVRESGAAFSAGSSYTIEITVYGVVHKVTGVLIVLGDDGRLAPDFSSSLLSVGAER